METIPSVDVNAMPDLVIRQVTKADLHALEWEGAYQHYRWMYANLYRSTRAGLALMWLVETSRRELIGQAFVMLVSGDKEAADGKNRAYVFGFRVKPEWRNRGVGRHLMTFIEDDLWQRGFRTITLNVAKDNPAALRLYQRLGYRVIASKSGIWSYKDHKGRLRQVNEPAWRMLKKLS